jgi:hypothetical protein
MSKKNLYTWFNPTLEIVAEKLYDKRDYIKETIVTSEYSEKEFNYLKGCLANLDDVLELLEKVDQDKNG